MRATRGRGVRAGAGGVESGRSAEAKRLEIGLSVVEEWVGNGRRAGMRALKDIEMRHVEAVKEIEAVLVACALRMQRAAMHNSQSISVEVAQIMGGSHPGCESDLELLIALCRRLQALLKAADGQSSPGERPFASGSSAEQHRAQECVSQLLSLASLLLFRSELITQSSETGNRYKFSSRAPQIVMDSIVLCVQAKAYGVTQRLCRAVMLACSALEQKQESQSKLVEQPTSGLFWILAARVRPETESATCNKENESDLSSCHTIFDSNEWTHELKTLEHQIGPTLVKGLVMAIVVNAGLGVILEGKRASVSNLCSLFGELLFPMVQNTSAIQNDSDATDAEEDGVRTFVLKELDFLHHVLDTSMGAENAKQGADPLVQILSALASLLRLMKSLQSSARQRTVEVRTAEQCAHAIHKRFLEVSRRQEQLDIDVEFGRLCEFIWSLFVALVSLHGTSEHAATILSSESVCAASDFITCVLYKEKKANSSASKDKFFKAFLAKRVSSLRLHCHRPDLARIAKLSYWVLQLNESSDAVTFAALLDELENLCSAAESTCHDGSIHLRMVRVLEPLRKGLVRQGVATHPEYGVDALERFYKIYSNLVARGLMLAEDAKANHVMSKLIPAEEAQMACYVMLADVHVTRFLQSKCTEPRDADQTKLSNVLQNISILAESLSPSTTPAGPSKSICSWVSGYLHNLGVKLVNLKEDGAKPIAADLFESSLALQTRETEQYWTLLSRLCLCRMQTNRHVDAIESVMEVFASFASSHEDEPLTSWPKAFRDCIILVMDECANSVATNVQMAVVARLAELFGTQHPALLIRMITLVTYSADAQAKDLPPKSVSAVPALLVKVMDLLDWKAMPNRDNDHRTSSILSYERARLLYLASDSRWGLHELETEYCNNLSIIWKTKYLMAQGQCRNAIWLILHAQLEPFSFGDSMDVDAPLRVIDALSRMVCTLMLHGYAVLAAQFSSLMLDLVRSLPLFDDDGLLVSRTELALIESLRAGGYASVAFRILSSPNTKTASSRPTALDRAVKGRVLLDFESSREDALEILQIRKRQDIGRNREPRTIENARLLLVQAKSLHLLGLYSDAFEVSSSALKHTLAILLEYGCAASTLQTSEQWSIDIGGNKIPVVLVKTRESSIWNSAPTLIGTLCDVLEQHAAACAALNQLSECRYFLERAHMICERLGLVPRKLHLGSELYHFASQRHDFNDAERWLTALAPIGDVASHEGPEETELVRDRFENLDCIARRLDSAQNFMEYQLESRPRSIVLELAEVPRLLRVLRHRTRILALSLTRVFDLRSHEQGTESLLPRYDRDWSYDLAGRFSNESRQLYWDVSRWKWSKQVLEEPSLSWLRSRAVMVEAQHATVFGAFKTLQQTHESLAPLIDDLPNFKSIPQSNEMQAAAILEKVLAFVRFNIEPFETYVDHLWSSAGPEGQHMKGGKPKAKLSASRCGVSLSFQKEMQAMHDMMEFADELVSHQWRVPDFELQRKIKSMLALITGRTDPWLCASLLDEASSPVRFGGSEPRNCTGNEQDALAASFDDMKLSSPGEKDGAHALRLEAAVRGMARYDLDVASLCVEQNHLGFLMGWSVVPEESGLTPQLKLLKVAEELTVQDVVQEMKQIVAQMRTGDEAIRRNFDPADVGKTALSNEQKAEWWQARYELEERLGRLIHRVQKTWIHKGLNVFGECKARTCVLLLDRYLHQFPWEALPCNAGRPISRMLNVCASYSQMGVLGANGQNIDRLAVPKESLAYILNPGGDLKATEERFATRFKMQRGWQGHCGLLSQDKVGEMMMDWDGRKDVLLYCGHGAGEKLLRPAALRSTDRLPTVAILMGCSSGKLDTRGRFDAQGILASYLQEGCCSVVANLWDVTDRDTDELTSRFLEMWAKLDPEPSSSAPKAKRGRPHVNPSNRSLSISCPNLDDRAETRSLAEALTRSRDCVKLQYLNGAATVAYGLPHIFMI
ncbi:Separin [Porphyridium purpureum]|uniref:separase n=1 Tax=Porphyridium purpureum TaxID=35688 RepID=A0A5J4YYK5_PORPP|nr:Separin [Porphyridium purpureum]|eukprot:POR8913..scf209_3